MSSTQVPPVGVVDEKLPMNKLSVLELLLECADALLCPTWDHEEREGHLTSISEALSSPTLPPKLRDLLTKAAASFKIHTQMSMADFIFSNRNGDLRLADELQAQVPLGMRYLYHGTAFGSLSGIAVDGLSPGCSSNWKGMVEEEHLQGVVFFDRTWRGAFDWAAVACAKMRGPRSSKNRRPVVLRIRRGNSSIEPDGKATKPGCFLTRSRVCTSDAEVLVGLQRGIPRWTTLREVV